MSSLGFRVDIEQIAHADGSILVFHIPQRCIGDRYKTASGKYLMSLVPLASYEDKAGVATISFAALLLKSLLPTQKPRTNAVADTRRGFSVRIP